MGKYKVRVKRSFGIYIVQWAYYRFIPVWYTVVEFDEPPRAYDHTTDGWDPKCFSYQDAEEFAKSINTYEKLKEYYKKEDEAEEIYLIDKNKRDEEEYPYKSKRIV